MFPPIDKDRVNYLLLSRPCFYKWITIYMPWGDSYCMDRDELMLYLSKLEVNSDVVNSLIDYLWNFFSVIFFVKDEHYEAISQEDIRDIVSGKKKLEIPECLTT